MDYAINNVPVSIEGRSFCFTGKAKMKRADIVAIVTSRGGTVNNRVTRDTDYLVVGGGGNSGWKYTGFGNKILRASYIQFMGGKVAIVGEEEFWEGTGGK